MNTDIKDVCFAAFGGTTGKRFAVYVVFDGTLYRYSNPKTGRNTWAYSTAVKHVRENTHLPRQSSYLEEVPNE